LAGFVFLGLILAGREKKWPGRYQAGVGSLLAALLLFYALPDIFLYTTEFLMAGESMFSTDFLFQVTGYAAGIIFVILAGTALFQTGFALGEKTAARILAAAIFINILSQSAALVQVLLARRIIPLWDWLFDLILPVINHKAYFLYAILLITLAIPLVLWRSSLHSQEGFRNPAEHRKIKARARRQRRWSGAVIGIYVLAVFCLTAGKAYSEQAVMLSPAEPFQLVADEIHIPLEAVNDGHLHRFAYTASDGIEVRFIVIKKNETSYGVGLDACDICGATGYYERENDVICKLCDVVMNKSTIGFKGGCNPVPLAFAMQAGQMVVQTESLENEKMRFK
jgi:uncharacterized membrane protein